MATASMPGIISGVDSATIAQLMALEAKQQTALKTKVTQHGTVVTALQKLNAKLATLATTAADLAKPTAWAPVKATSSSDKVTVAAANGASTGTTTFQVKNLAVAHSVQFTELADSLTDVVVPADADGKHMVTIAGADGPVEVDAGDGSLGALVAALNRSPAGVTATTVSTVDGYRLRVTAKETGAESTFSLGSASGPILGGVDPARTVTGKDARLVVGGDEVVSATNTVAGLGTGLSVVLGSGTPIDTDITVEVTSDAAAMTATMKSFIGQVNAILDDIDAQATFNETTKLAGVLSREGSVRDLRSNLLNAIFPGDGTSMANLGVQLDRYGNVVFDEKKFTDAYSADPVTVQAAFADEAGTGMVQRYEKVAKDASDSVDGNLTKAVEGRQATIKQLESSIAAWDVRLELREKTITRQFTALDTYMNEWQNLGSWLSGQIASLPGYSTS